MFETGIVRANDCESYRQVRRHNRYIFSIFFNMKVCYVVSLELPHRGDSNEYLIIPFSIYKKKTITQNDPKYNKVCNYVFVFVRDSRTSSK